MEKPDKNMFDSNLEQLNNLTAHSSPTNDFFGFLWDLLKTGVIVLALAFAIRYFAIQPYIVDGESMMPNYENYEYLLAEKISYWFNPPQRGDVVVFRYPGNPSINYIKRIIGLPGEKVKIENNKITIFNNASTNGEVLQESYIPQNTKTYAYSNEGKIITLHENEYFVLGDNREHSSDSREWGVLPKANIAGRSWLSLAKLKPIGSGMPHFYIKLHKRVAYPDFSYIGLFFARLDKI